MSKGEGHRKEQRPQEGSEREGKVGEEGQGRRSGEEDKQMERRAPETGRQPILSEEKDTPEERGQERELSLSHGSRKGHLSHFTNAETEARGGEVVCARAGTGKTHLPSLSLSLSLHSLTSPSVLSQF